MPINILYGRADGKQETREGEEFAGVDIFAVMLDAAHHTFGDVSGFLHGERTLRDLFVLALDGFFEEARVGGDGIEAGELDVFGHFEADAFLEALHCKLACGIERVAGHRHFADGGDGDRHMPLFAREVFDVLLIGVDGRIDVDFEDVVYPIPIDVVHALVVREARVGVEDVYAAEFFGRGGKDEVDVFLCGHVADHGDDLFGVELAYFVDVQVDREDLGAHTK